MKRENLEDLNNEVISKHERLKELDLKKRRDSIIKMRDARSKKAKKSAIFLVIFGLLCFTATFHLWYIQFNMSRQSNLGIFAGFILAAFGFQYLYSNRVPTYKKLFSDDFTDEDITTYFQEEEKVNRQALDQWSRFGRYIVLICGGILVFLINFETTEEFGIMFLSSGLTLFILGISILVLFLRPRSYNDFSCPTPALADSGVRAAELIR